jgi:heptosyltransferase-3
LLAEEMAGGNDGWVTINPFSRWKYKEWGYGKWEEVIEWLYDEHGLRSVLVGSKEEAGAAAGLAGKCNGHALSLAGKTTLGELAALLGLSSLHLGVDSAAPHIAAAVGTPSVTIFGPSDWRAWMIPDATHRVVTPDKDCVPCSKKGCDHSEISICLDEMGTERMKSTIGDVLKVLGERMQRQRAEPL